MCGVMKAMEKESSPRRVLEHLDDADVRESPQSPPQYDVGVDLVFTAQRLDQIRSDNQKKNKQESNADLRGFIAVIAHDKSWTLSSDS
jgi:hypothetical protein